MIRLLENSEGGARETLEGLLSPLGNPERPATPETIASVEQALIEGISDVLTIDKPSDYYRVGAEVYAPGNPYTGRILAIDERSGVATVEFEDWWFNTIEDFLLRELSVAAGCLRRQKFCVGDRVYKNDSWWWHTSIRAVDFYTDRATLIDDDNNSYSVPPQRLLLRQGCLGVYCFNDSLSIKEGGSNNSSWNVSAAVEAVGESDLLLKYRRYNKWHRLLIRPAQLAERIAPPN